MSWSSDGEGINECQVCGKDFMYHKSFYTDQCDPCTAQKEGKTVEQLYAEDFDPFGQS
jgi:hypothetical protein